MANYTAAIPFIKKAEGGLSRVKTDSASAHPAPWPYNGHSDWHTNKGVTYQTFAALAPKLGYAITPENFFAMPDAIWYKIYKTYWDSAKGDLIDSTAIAIALVDWYYNGSAKPKTWLNKSYGIPLNAMPFAKDTAAAINKVVKQHLSLIHI